MLEEAKKPPLLMSDLGPTPLWGISKSAFGTKSNFQAIAQPQAIACTQIFFYGMKVDPTDLQHNQFCLKRAKIWYPISQEWMGIFKKNFHRCLFSLSCTKYLKIKNI